MIGYTNGTRKLTCDGWCKGAGVVTHIGSKGYAYCGPCAVERRQSGYERTRKMLARERKTLEAGGQLASYDRKA